MITSRGGLGTLASLLGVAAGAAPSNCGPLRAHAAAPGTGAAALGRSADWACRRGALGHIDLLRRGLPPLGS
eukprot:1680103-Pyramimonas_sp.AAC.1